MKDSRKAFNSIDMQSGSALLVTLFVLLLIAMVSVMAIRRGSSDLKMSTAAQVDKLVFQANDFAINKFEKEGATSNFGRIDNVMGYLLLSDEDPVGREVTFCIKQSNNRFFNVAAITERNITNGYIKNKNTGFCDATSDGFTSKRKVMMTQMTLAEKQVDRNAEKLRYEYDKTNIPGRRQDGKDDELRPKYVEVKTNALIPAYSINTSPSEIKTCMQNRSSQVSSPLVTSAPVLVKECLDNKGVMNNEQTQEYYYRPQGLNVISN